MIGLERRAQSEAAVSYRASVRLQIEANTRNAITLPATNPSETRQVPALCALGRANPLQRLERLEPKSLDPQAVNTHRSRRSLAANLGIREI